MSVFSNRSATTAPDKHSSAYAVTKYNTARSNLLLAVAFTVVNMLLSIAGSGVYLLFSISFPYLMFDSADILWSVPAIAVLALYVIFYLFSKKKPGFMVAALVTFILDFLILIGYSLFACTIPELEITVADFLIDYLTHIWVLVYLIIGARYAKRYKAAICETPELLTGSLLKNAAVPEEPIPADPVSLETAETEQPVETADADETTPTVFEQETP